MNNKYIAACLSLVFLCSTIVKSEQNVITLTSEEKVVYQALVKMHNANQLSNLDTLKMVTSHLQYTDFIPLLKKRAHILQEALIKGCEINKETVKEWYTNNRSGIVKCAAAVTSLLAAGYGIDWLSDYLNKPVEDAQSFAAPQNKYAPPQKSLLLNFLPSKCFKKATKLIKWCVGVPSLFAAYRYVTYNSRREKELRIINEMIAELEAQQV